MADIFDQVAAKKGVAGDIFDQVSAAPQPDYLSVLQGAARPSAAQRTAYKALGQRESAVRAGYAQGMQKARVTGPEPGLLERARGALGTAMSYPWAVTRALASRIEPASVVYSSAGEGSDIAERAKLPADLALQRSWKAKPLGDVVGELMQIGSDEPALLEQQTAALANEPPVIQMVGGFLNSLPRAQQDPAMLLMSLPWGRVLTGLGVPAKAVGATQLGLGTAITADQGVQLYEALKAGDYPAAGAVLPWAVAGGLGMRHGLTGLMRAAETLPLERPVPRRGPSEAAGTPAVSGPALELGEHGQQNATRNAVETSPAVLPVESVTPGTTGPVVTPVAPGQKPKEVMPRGEEVQAQGGREVAPELAVVEPAPLSSVARLPVADIAVDPERFQFKVGTGSEGTTGAQRGKVWNEDLAGIMHVWRDPENGQTYVVNGHHRLALARENGVGSVDAKYIEVPTASEARAVGALQNIAEGHGTAIDAAKFFRETGMGPEGLREKGLTVRDRLVSDGLALAQLPDALWMDVYRGNMPVDRGVALGSGDLTASQRLALAALVEKRGVRDPDVIRELGRFVREAPTATEEGGLDLGLDPIEQSLAVEKASLVSWLKGELSKDRRLFGQVSKDANAERLAQGGNQIAIDESRAIAEHAKMIGDVFDQQSMFSGPVSDAVNEAARIWGSRGEKAAKQYLRDRIPEVVRTLVGGREAAGAGGVRAAESGGSGRSGGAFAETSGEGRPEQSTLDASPAGLKTAVGGEEHAMPSPELVELWELMTGSAPLVRKLRRSFGLFHSDTGQIHINPLATRDPIEGARVLAHEIGHGIDWLPDREKGIPRGNILGRVASLHRYLKHTLNGLKGSTRNDLMTELKALTQWWKPFDVSANRRFTQYRHSPVELYADALSVWLNAPRELQTRAPLTYELLHRYANAKPEVWDAYNRVQRVLAGGAEAVAEHRSSRIQAGYDVGERILRAEREAGKKPLRDYARDLSQGVFGVQAPISVMERELSRKGANRPATVAWEELQHRENANRVLLEDVADQVVAPLEKARVGIVDADGKHHVDSVGVLGEYLQYKRIVDGGRSTFREVDVVDGVDEAGNTISHKEMVRDEMANPLGHTPETAQQGLDTLRQRLGEEKWGLLEASAAKFHDLVWQSTERALDSGLYSKSLRPMLEKNRGSYAHFAVLDYLTERLNPMIKEQTGTFKAIANPFSMTLARAMQVNRACAFQEARQAILVDMMLPRFPEEITKRPMVRTRDGAIKDPVAEKGKQIVLHYEDGKPVRYEVSDYVAEVFKGQQMHPIFEALRNVNYKVFHQFFVTFSSAFQVRNLIRDPMRTWVNLAGVIGGEGRTAGLRGTGRLAAGYAKTLPNAIRYARTGRDPLIRQMLLNNEISPTQYRLYDDPNSTAYSRAMQRYGLLDQRDMPTSRFKRGVERLTGAMRLAADVGEIWSKTAASEALTRGGVEGRERAYYVRNYAGTPPTARRGTWSGPMETVYMYSRVAVQGMLADWEARTTPRTAGGAWLRSFLVTALPKAAMAAAAAGYFGKQIQEQMQRISQRDLASFTCVPLGTVLDEEGKEQTVFLRLPVDDTDRGFGIGLWHLTHGQVQTAAKDVTDTLPNEAPLWKMGSAWYEYALGGNPRDAFRGRDIIGEDEQKARAKTSLPAASDMVNWTADQFGVISSVKQKVVRPWYAGPQTDLGKKLDMVPGMRALVKVSHSGEREREAQIMARAEAEKAVERLGRSAEERRAAREKDREQRLNRALRTVEE